MVYVHSGVLFSHEEEWIYNIYRKVDGTGDHHAM
jgi:hypothetical protein